MFTELSRFLSRKVTHITANLPNFSHYFDARKRHRPPGGPDQARYCTSPMPAEFGLAMAIFVVIASMVGVGVLTTSGYTMALVGSNQFMLISGSLGA